MNAPTLVDFVCRSDAAESELSDLAGRTVDGVALCNAADAIAAALAVRGIEPGDVVASVLPRSAERLAALIGTAAGRATFLALPPTVETQAVVSMLRLHRVALVLAGSPVPPAVRTACEAAGTEIVTVRFGGSRVALIDDEPVFEPQQRRADPDDVALLLPDGRSFTHRALVAALRPHGLPALAELLDGAELTPARAA